MKLISPSILLFALYFINGASVAALPVGTEEQSIASRQNVGSTITVGGRQYRLISEISGESGALTFEAQAVAGGGRFFAKRPTRNPPPADFTAEISNTQHASTVLGTGIFVSSGTDLGFSWMITAPAPGGEIWLRWERNRAAFATRAACEADMTTARTVIVNQNQRLANDPRTRFVHGDNHPGNWFVPATGTIHTAVPIDFGLVRPPPPTTNIANLIRDQYIYRADMWSFFSQNGFCR
ncbi:hypothetical protein P691DRAFT_759144 [Macrolepiota fuliginosa MF-IS2]|uniref:Aminoglycoside phosphotransferase domain-containing protein n=1 Tax=Macrolepiota fuliginosa MF-IS2 TaxID=1400762 RepID=A0A9P6C5H0_9AGAR|nr:hypothetical protein P691DRAFT_759144 [Macrolepiota fuliginosa MF-IS2]